MVKILIGVYAIIWGGGLLYYSRAKHIPSIVKPLMRTWWIKSEATNRKLSAILGAFSIVSGLIFIIAGIMGWDIWPPV